MMTEVSATTQAILDLVRQRDAAGRAKYGATLDRTDLSHADWLQHAAEEALDMAGYLLAAKREGLFRSGQSTQEPVAWRMRSYNPMFQGGYAWAFCTDPEHVTISHEPLYLAPQNVSLPPGWVAVPREKLEQITDAIFSRHHNAKENGDAYEVGYLGAMLEDLEGMLAAAPEPPK